VHRPSFGRYRKRFDRISWVVLKVDIHICLCEESQKTFFLKIIAKNQDPKQPLTIWWPLTVFEWWQSIHAVHTRTRHARE
jgi:hypothetical protein